MNSSQVGGGSKDCWSIEVVIKFRRTKSSYAGGSKVCLNKGAVVTLYLERSTLGNGRIDGRSDAGNELLLIEGTLD